MSSRQDKDPRLAIMRYLNLAQIGLSITSCIMRADYNIVFSFLLVILLWKEYFQDEKYYLKIIIHVCAVLCIFDILWFIICMPTWIDGDTKNEFWNNLHGMHWFIVLLAFIEFGIKIGIAYISYEIYKVKYKNEIGYLTSFEYGKTARNQEKS